MNNQKKRKWPIILLALILLAAIGNSNSKDDSGTATTTTTKKPAITQSATNTPVPDTTATEQPDAELQFNLLPYQLSPEGYTGAECWLLYESEYTENSANPKIIEVYAAVDPTDADWHEQVKKVITMLAKEFKNYDDVTFKVFCSMDNETISGQMSYNNLIAIWESKPPVVIGDRSPRIIWYSPNTSAVKGQETEIWSP